PAVAKTGARSERLQHVLEAFHIRRIDLKPRADALQQLSLPPHLVIRPHEIRRELQVADACQADGELLLLRVEYELFLFGFGCGRDHVRNASDGARLSGDAAVRFALIVFSDGDAPDSACPARYSGDLQRGAV